MKFELFPSSMAEQFVVLVELPKGASLQSTADHMNQIEALIAELPDEELESFVTRIGTQEVYPASGYPPGENEHWAFVSVSLSPYTERDRGADQFRARFGSELYGRVYDQSRHAFRVDPFPRPCSR